MAKRKSTKKYYFSVEGETEQWYLKWLQGIVNNTEESAYKVSFDCPVQKNPLKRAKSLVITGKTEVYHLSDYESDEPIHTQQFKDVMDNMRKDITPLNRAYHEHFESMEEYKHEDNFKRCLGNLQLSDVIEAVRRAKAIMKRNQDSDYILHEYKGYKYYKENPSLAIWEVIEKIMKDCELQ